MKKNNITFDTENLANSFINLIKFEKKTISIFLIITFFLSLLFSIFYEKKKYLSVELEHHYISQPSLFTHEIISPSSFELFIKKNFNENMPTYILNHNFPEFFFKAKKENEINFFIIEIDKLLESYIEFIKKNLNDRLLYLSSEKNKGVEYLDLKYTLNSLINEKIFINKSIDIVRPDHISITFIKISIFIFILMFFLRVFYLISIERIKIK